MLTTKLFHRPSARLPLLPPPLRHIFSTTLTPKHIRPRSERIDVSDAAILSSFRSSCRSSTHRSSTVAEIRCPACLTHQTSHPGPPSSPLSLATCSACDSFLPVNTSSSHFAHFGLPQAYRLDRSALRRQYLRWQQSVHPDLSAGRQTAQSSSSLNSKIQHELASQWSITINRARAILEDDVKRAAYMVRWSFPQTKHASNPSDPCLGIHCHPPTMNRS